MKILSNKFEFFLIIFFFVFSWWLMYKSFGYDSSAHSFRVARHQVGDFGLHLSLIRSFSWGNNFPAESPFYPGRPLPYHYYFDFAVGLLERIGIRIDLALNGLSAISFTLLLFFIYKLPQVIFKKNLALGILSVALFIFHSNLTFIDFIKGRGLSFSLFSDLWNLGDYLHKGPFDGSIISIFFTLNVFLNQRHLVAALAISLGLLYFFLRKTVKSERVSTNSLVLAGIIFGLSSRLHTLVFLSSLLIIFLLLVQFKRYRFILPFFTPAIFLFGFHFKDILNQELTHPFINLGFLASRPLTFENFVLFWFLNLGLALLLIPLGFVLSNNNGKKVFLSVLPLFIFANLFQFSFRIEQNHSLLNYFLIIANFYIAFLLTKLWKIKLLGKMAVIVITFFLLISGFIDLMAVKNDYQYVFYDAPRNKFMAWIKNNTDKNDIFLAKKEILDPVTLSGRKNYLGHQYYMGYNPNERENFVKEVFEANEATIFEKARGEKIKYITIPLVDVVDFNYKVDKEFFQNTLNIVYEDDEVGVFQL